VGAKAFLVKEMNSNTTLLEKNTKELLPIASITKLMTTMLASDYFEKEKLFTFTTDAVTFEGAPEFSVGDTFRLEDMIKASLIASSNKAAFLLGSAISDDPVFLMNKRAEEIGMKLTHFSDPTGLDDVLNFSTAQDLYMLATYILNQYPLLGAISVRDSEVITTVDGIHSYALINTNPLVKELQGSILLSKTGTTEGAKQCLLMVVQKGVYRFVIVILGSDNRTRDARAIFDWLSQFQ
jgi:D-alanyl-D-alanine carboxypeptidase